MAPFNIVFEKSAGRDLEALSPPVKKRILTEIDRHLTHNPHIPHGSRIKKLHHLKLPLYRLRVGDYRIYYRMHFQNVVILAVLNRKESDRWLKMF